MDSIYHDDILSLQKKWIEEGKAAATVNKHLALLRYIFNLSIKWGIAGVTNNPAKNIILLPVSNARQRFLSAEEVKPLIDAVRQSKNQMLEPVISMLLITGARKREVLDSQWNHIDWELSLWKIPKTKAGKPRFLPLAAAALELLESQRVISGHSNFIFPNPKTDKPFQSVYYSWNAARNEAGLHELRIHDLRHSFASFLINGGRSLYEVQMLLGHSNTQMTQRYAHLAQRTLTDASDVAGTLISRSRSGF